MTKLYIKKLTDTPTPKKATKYSAGMDIHAVIKGNLGFISLSPNQTVIIDTGLIMRPEIGYCIKFYPRSGLAAKLGLALGNCVALIDVDYNHECKVILHNHSNDHVQINDGERICQMMVERVEDIEIIVVETFPEIDSDRVGGLGSTGK